MRVLQGVVALAGVALIVACDSSDKKASTPSAAATSAPASASATVTTTRPAATSTVATVATATAAPPTQVPDATATPPPAPPPENTQAPPPPASGTLTVVAINLLFDATSLSAAAGSVTIVFNNQDKAIAHNMHFFSKSSGGSIGMTEVTTGPATDTLSLGTLAPGTYFYKCDVHPTTMTGILIVS